MLHCVYHPIEKMRVVDDEDREKLLATGAWFDSPKEAKALRDHHEEKILNEPKPRKKRVVKEKEHEKSSNEQQRLCEGGTEQNESQDG